MSNTSNNYLESLFEGVNIILDKRLEDVSYDTTVICTVTDDSNAKNGAYKVTDGTISYDAYADTDKYLVGDQVRVTVPMGDFSQKKFISGKYVTDNDSNPITYVSPADSVMNISGNLALGVKGGIVANGKDKERVLWHTTLDDSFISMQDNDIYNTIVLKADFRTVLSSYDLIAGNYGLRLDFLVCPTSNSTVHLIRSAELDSKEMFGNPYSFSIYSPQAKVFKIGTIGIIKAIVLTLYQKGNFKDKKTGIITPFAENDNIFVDNIVLGLGCDLKNIDDNKLQIYTENALTYKYGQHDNTSNLKTMGLLWFNKDDNNQYIGFSDGVYDADYDEIDYLKKSKVENRLIAQQGKENVPPDKRSLVLAANIEEAAPAIKKAVDVVNKDLVQILRQLKQSVSAVDRYTKNLDKLLGAAGDKYLVTYTDNISNYLDDEDSCGLVQQYAEILKHGYNLWKGNSTSWNSKWGNERGTQIYNEFQKIRDAIDWLLDTSDGGGFKGILTTYNGFKSIYDTYKIRINRIMATMDGYLGVLKDNNETEYGQYKKYFPSGVIGASETEDYASLKSYNKSDRESFMNGFTVYKAPDMTSYDYKYCIYWFRYEKDYKAPDDEQILGDGWRRITNEDFYEQIQLTSESYEKNKYYTYNKSNKKFSVSSKNFDEKTVYYQFPSEKCFTQGDKDRINIGLSGIYFYDDDSDFQYKYRKTETYNKDRKYYEEITTTENGKEKITYRLINNPTKEAIEGGTYYARVCVNSDGKYVHKPKVNNGNGLLKRYMQNDLEQEKYKAVLFYNHNMYTSNELVFDNAEVVPDKTTLDKGDILIFEHLENSHDDYQSYAITTYLMDASDETRLRQIRCHYDGLLAKDNAFVNGLIYWYVPNQSTMLTVDANDLVNNKGFAIDETRSSFSYEEVDFVKSNRKYKANTYYEYDGKKYEVREESSAPSAGTKLYEKIYTTYCFYKKIEATKKSDDEITTETKEWDKWDYDNGTKIDNRDFWYKIQPVYYDSAKNNVITCKFAKHKDSDEVLGEQLFTFGIKGTSGTKYTLSIAHSTSQIAANGESGLNLKATLKDFNNNPIETSKLQSGLSVNWLGYQTTEATESNVVSPALNMQTGNTEYTFNTAKGCFGIFKASANIELTGTTLSTLANISVDDSTSDDNAAPTGRVRSVDLETLYAVPFCGHCADATNILYANDFYIQGPSQIIYNSLGTLDNNSIFNTPYRLFANKDCSIYGINYKQGEVINNVDWSIQYCKIKDGIFTPLDAKDVDGKNIYTQKEIEFYDAYMPKLSGNSLTPATMYLSGLDCYPIVSATIKESASSKNFIYLWRQPIIILQNKYASSMLNDWDGSFQIDEENGTILSSMVGAGRKNPQTNTFEGVLMGDVAIGTGSNIGFENGKDIGLKNQTGLGLYGFQDGQQSFGFNIDGTAFLGKAGKGRIIFNGDSGTIASANWFTGEYNQQNDKYDAVSNPYPNGGKIDQSGKISKHSNAGMCLDLDQGHIDAYNFKLTSKNIYLNSNPNDVNIPGSSNVRDEYDGYLMRIGDEKKTGYIGLKSDGELEIRVNSLHITGSLGEENLLKQTAPQQISTIKHWNQYTKTIDAELDASGNVVKKETQLTSWKKQNHDSNGNFSYTWKLNEWINPDADGKPEWDIGTDEDGKKINQANTYKKDDQVIQHGNLWTASAAIAQHQASPGDNDSKWIPSVTVVTNGDKEKVIHVDGNNKQLYQHIKLRDNKKYTISGYARSTVKDKTFGLIVGRENSYEIIYSNLDDNNLYYDSATNTSMPREWKFGDTDWHSFRCTVLTPGSSSKDWNTRRIGFTCEVPFEFWHVKLEEGEVASAWTPSPDDVTENTESTKSKYDQSLAQNKLFDKLFKDETTGLMMDGIELVPADKSITGVPELYINASYIATGILRSKNWDGVIKAKYNTTNKEYDYSVSTAPKFGMYLDLNQGKIWAAKFELNAWDYDNASWDDPNNPTVQNKGKGLYLNSDPIAKTGSNLNTHSYYLKLGDLTKSFITFDIDGNLNMSIKNGLINATSFILDAWDDTNNKGLYLDSDPGKGKSYFRVGKPNNELRYYLNSDGKDTTFEISAKNFVLDAWNTTSNAGIYLNSSPASSGDYFRIGDTDTSYIKFNQAGSLDIKSSIFNLKAGTSPNTISINSGASSCPLNIGNGVFKVYWNGHTYASSVNIAGTINATGGTIGGWTINSTSLSGNGIISGGSISGSSISGGSINIGSGVFKVGTGGALTATSANIVGTINATGGTIGGWTINTNSLSGSGIISGGTVNGSTVNGATITGGSINIGSGTFAVSSTGVLSIAGGTSLEVNGHTAYNGTQTLIVDAPWTGKNYEFVVDKGIITNVSITTIKDKLFNKWSDMVSIVEAVKTNVGASDNPIYIAESSFKACSGTYGGGKKLMYISKGTFTNSSTTVGASNKPVYLNNGVFTACDEYPDTSSFITSSALTGYVKQSESSHRHERPSYGTAKAFNKDGDEITVVTWIGDYTGYSQV